MDDLKAVTALCKHSKEVVLTETLHEEEIMAINQYCKVKKFGVIVTQSKRMLIINCDKLEEALELLSEFGLVEYIGSLREIIDWEINHTTFDPPVTDKMSFTFKPE